MKYDLAIIGAGPAGLSASVYASRYGLKNIVIGEPGGLTGKAHKIGNWLGTKEIDGFEFAQKAEEHARSYGVEIEYMMAKKLEGEAGNFKITLDNGKEIEARALLIATGTAHRSLGVPGEKEFSGKGVSHCATCDGFFYKGKTVAIIGGSDSAAGAAVFMSEIAEKIYVVYRGEALRCETFWLDKIAMKEKIEIICPANVKEIKGSDKAEELILDTEYKGSNSLKIDGIFVEIGFVPTAELVNTLGVKLDEENYIIIDKEGKTNIEGVWAAGDITTGSNKLKQIVTAAAEGAIAAASIQKNLKK